MGILDFIRSAQVASAISVDGVGDKATVKAMQKFFKVSPQDGIISGQNKDMIKAYAPALTAVTYGKNGSKTVSALQKWCGAKQDGIWGKETSTKLQEKLVKLEYLKSADVDGICGTKTMKAFQKCLNNNGKKKPSTLGDKIMDTCKKVAARASKASYGWRSNPSWDNIDNEGTCVSFVAVVLQLLGYKKEGNYVWQNGKGYGTGKVTGATDRMDVTYFNNPKLSTCKSKIKKGDILVFDDNKSGKSGDGGHICIATGDWSGNDCMVWDIGKKMMCERTGKPRAYDGSHKLRAIVRLK